MYIFTVFVYFVQVIICLKVKENRSVTKIIYIFTISKFYTYNSINSYKFTITNKK